MPSAKPTAKLSAHSFLRRWRAPLVLAAVSSLATMSPAQGLITSGTVVALERSTVPDANGDPIPGLTFGGATSQIPFFNAPQIDDSGVVVFRSRMALDGPVPTPIYGDDSQAVFFGTNPADLRMAVRGGDAAPGIPNTLVGNSTVSDPFVYGVRMSAAGTLLFHADLGPPQPVIPTPPLGSAFFGGQPSAFAPLVQTGDVAPGTGGATFFQLRKDFAHGLGGNGQLWFLGSLDLGSGTPPVGSTPQAGSSGIWAGSPGALQLVARIGAPLAGSPGLNIAPGALLLPYSANESGELLFKAGITAIVGPAAPGDRSLCVYRPGFGSQLIAQLGAPVPGLPGLTYRVNPALVNGGDLYVHERSLTRTGDVLIRAQLDGTPDPDGWAMLRWSAGSTQLLTESGTPTAGINGTLRAPIDLLQNDSGLVTFKSWFDDGAEELQGIWVGRPGAWTLVAREGQVMPGTGGGMLERLDDRFDSTNRQVSTFHLGDSGSLLFSCTLSGGSNPGRSLWLWTALRGLEPVLMRRDPVTLPSGEIRRVGDYRAPMPSINQSDGDGGSASVSRTGRLALRVDFTNSTYAIMTVDLPGSTFPFCFGNGTAPPSCGACPCGNTDFSPQAMGGCLNSSDRSATLRESGVLGNPVDSLRFSLTGATSDSLALLISGDNRLPMTGPCLPGTGLTSYDGLRCVGGGLLRHGVRPTDANGDVIAAGLMWGEAGSTSTSFPGLAGGQTRHFQVLYRDNPSLRCQTGQNSTNAVSVTFY